LDKFRAKHLSVSEANVKKTLRPLYYILNASKTHLKAKQTGKKKEDRKLLEEESHLVKTLDRRKKDNESLAEMLVSCGKD